MNLAGRENTMHPQYSFIHKEFITMSDYGFHRFCVILRQISIYPHLIRHQSTVSLSVDKVGIKNNPRFPADHYNYNSFIYRIIVVGRLN
jgi:hypothetical protein